MPAATKNTQKPTTKGKKVVIYPTTSYEEVLQYDKEGRDLVWDPENFHRLTEEEVRGLRAETKARYSVFLELAEEAAVRNPEEEEITARIKVSDDVGSAMTKLEIRNKRKGMSYRWERPDMVDVRLDEGYRYAKGIKTLRGAGPDGVHRIGTHGQTELVALEVPEAVIERKRRERHLRRKRAIDGIPSKTRADVEKLGGHFVDEGTSANGNFQPISQEEVTNG